MVRRLVAVVLLCSLSAHAMDGGSLQTVCKVCDAGEPSVVAIQRAKLCAAGADGGCSSDAPWIETPGWRLSGDQLKKVATHISKAEAAQAECAAKLESAELQQPALPIPVWIGLGLGFATGLVGGLWLVNELRK